MKVPLSRPDIKDSEAKAVLNVLKTPYLALGPKMKEFEEKISSYIGIKYAIALNSGTSGLHLIVRTMKIGRGDEVITTPFSFIASANCILYEGARPVFVDVDKKTLCIDPKRVEKAITKRTKAILAVDVFGHPANWRALKKIAKKHNLYLIEDSAEALGSEYYGKKCGSFGDAAILSFYPNKQMTTGEGGMVITNNNKIAEDCNSLRNQGRGKMTGEWNWLSHVQLGYNYRISDINCALGIAQMARIKEILAKRQRVANLYNKKIGEVPEIEIPYIDSGVKMSWFVYVIKLKEGYSEEKRNAVLKKLKKAGVGCQNYFPCIHLQPLYKKKFGYKPGDFPISEDISQRTIALPFHNNLKEKEIDYVVKALRAALI